MVTVSEWEGVCMKGENNSPLLTGQVLLAPPPPASDFYCPPLFSQNSEVASRGTAPLYWVWVSYYLTQGMTAIQGGKFGPKSILLLQWTANFLVNQESVTLSSFYLPPTRWVGLLEAGTVSIQEANLDDGISFYQPLA